MPLLRQIGASCMSSPCLGPCNINPIDVSQDDTIPKLGSPLTHVGASKAGPMSATSDSVRRPESPPGVVAW